MPDLDPTWRRPALVWDEFWNADDAFMAKHLLSPGLLISAVPEHLGADQIEQELTHYPTAAGLVVRRDPHLGAPGTRDEVVRERAPTGEICPRVAWQDSSRVLDFVAPDYRALGSRFLLPALSTGDAISPLMLWWLLLFGLSMVARYDPEVWTAAIDINGTREAGPLENALDIALEAVPDLILEALIGADDA